MIEEITFIKLPGASTIRYRRSIGLFDRFTVATRVLAWDEKSLYIEQKFLRFSDNFVCAIVLVKQSLVSGTIEDLFKAALSTDSGESGQNIDAFSQNPEALVSPPFPEELSLWIESNAISSQKLNPQRLADVSEKQQASVPLEVSDEQKESSSHNARSRCVTEEKRDSN